MLDAGAAAVEQLRGRANQLDGRFAAREQARRAPRDPDRARPTEAFGERKLLVDQRLGAVKSAKLLRRQRGLRSPWQDGRVDDPQSRVVSPDGKEGVQR